MNPLPVRRRVAIVLLPTYALLAWMALWLRRPVLDVAALLVLLGALALALPPRAPAAWRLGWLLLAALLLALAAAGAAGIALGVVPVLATVALGWLFGHTLRAGREPLVGRFIRIIEGEQRLAAPGVARYARQVTWFWTLLLGAQAAALLWVLVFALPGGLAQALGWTVAAALPQRAMSWYAHLGAWLLPALAMFAEYGFRRWHLRHLPHLATRTFFARIIACWPRLLQGALPAARA